MADIVVMAAIEIVANFPIFPIIVGAHALCQALAYAMFHSSDS